jgi:intraflagellar transport protein 80
MKLGWSTDGTICAGAGGSGQIIYGYIVDRSLSYENWEINLNEDNK